MKCDIKFNPHIIHQHARMCTCEGIDGYMLESIEY